MDENLKNQLESLAKRVEEAESNVNAAKNIINKIYEEYLRVDYTQIEGETGEFDGFNMVTSEGKKFEVNQNYAAKSKLVYGDVLKLMQEDGKDLFKQIKKVDKERVEGILTKKEGEWYLLTDRGSHRVSDAAAEYHKAEINSQAVAYLPADNLDAPFATLDTVEGPSVIKEEKKQTSSKSKEIEENIKDLDKKEIDLKKKPTENKPAKKETKPTSTKSKAKKPAASSSSKPKRSASKTSKTTNDSDKKGKQDNKSDDNKLLDADDLV